MKKLLALAPCAALIFGCSGGPFGGGAVSLQPGMWEQTVQFTTIEAPGAPPEMLQMMRAMMGQPRTSSSCITAEQAANPAESFGRPERRSDVSCQFEPNAFANGTINLRGTCSSPTSGNVSMTTTGSYTATTMEATMNHQMTAPPNTPGPQSLRLEGRMTARRTGDCPAGAAAGNSAG